MLLTAALTEQQKWPKIELGLPATCEDHWLNDSVFENNVGVLPLLFLSKKLALWPLEKNR